MMNKLGWAIGAVLIVGVGVIFFLIVRKPGGPQANIPDALLARVQIPALPAYFGQPSEAGNAGELYARAIARVQADEPFDPQIMLDAAKKKDIKLFDGPLKLETLWEVRRTPEVFKTISELSSQTIKQVEKYDQAKEREKALELLKAMAIFGHKLTQDGIRLRAIDQGIYTQMQALTWLKSMLKEDPANAKTVEELEEWENKLRETNADLSNKANDFIFKVQIGAFVPDFIKIAQEDQTRAMRVEALMMLGMAQHAAQDEDKQERIKQVLTEAAKDPDPLVKAAAEWAKKITVADFNLFGSTN